MAGEVAVVEKFGWGSYSRSLGVEVEARRVLAGCVDVNS